MKVYINAASRRDNYPTICGVHEFANIAEAIDFAYYGAKGLNNEVHQLIIDFEPGKYVQADMEITIYDDYVE